MEYYQRGNRKKKDPGAHRVQEDDNEVKTIKNDV